MPRLTSPHRCRKCGVPGEPHQVAHHQKTCRGEDCPDCDGYGKHFFVGGTRGYSRPCASCDGTGIKGGREEMWRLHAEAIERYRAEMAEAK